MMIGRKLLLAVSLLCIALFTHISPAQMPDQVDPSALSVAGVRLGMTPDEAIESLKKFENFPILKKRYVSHGPISGFGSLGSSEDCPDFKKSPTNLLVAIVAARANRSNATPAATNLARSLMAPQGVNAECEWHGRAVGASKDQDPLEVAVYLIGVPGHEHVTAVSLIGWFHNKPLVQSIMDGALQRYPSQVTYKGPGSLAWRLDARGRVRSLADLFGITNRQLSPYYMDIMKGALSFYQLRNDQLLRPANFESDDRLPILARGGGGVGLDFAVSPDNANNQLASYYAVSLYREGDLVQFSSVANDYFKKLAEQNNQKVLDNAKQNGSEIKY